MDDKYWLNKQVAALENSQEPMPILMEFLELMNTGDSGTREICQSGLLAYFDKLRKTEPHEVMGETIKLLRSKCIDGTAAADFLENAYKAYELIIDEAYNKILRTMSSAYLFDGSVLCCPECKSLNVYEGENSMYEFTHLICRDCGHWGLPDDYQIEDWYRK